MLNLAHSCPLPTKVRTRKMGCLPTAKGGTFWDPLERGRVLMTSLMVGWSVPQGRRDEVSRFHRARKGPNPGGKHNNVHVSTISDHTQARSEKLAVPSKS